MIHNKQHYLLYCLVLSFQFHNVSAALVAIAEAGAVANTAAFVVREAVAEALGTASSSVVKAANPSELQAHASMETIMSSLSEVMNENVSSVSSSSSSSSSSDSSAVEAAAQKSEQLRAATNHVLRYWANNSSIISALSRTSLRAVQNALMVIPKPVAGQSPVKVPAVSEYADALQYVTARQEYAFLKSNYDVILPSEIEVLAPMTAGDLTVIMPPVSATVDFLPKQQLYLFVNCFGEKALTTTVQNKLISDLSVQCEKSGLFDGLQSSMSEKGKQSMLQKWCKNIKQYATSIQKSIVQALQAQNAAEVQASGASNDLWTIFQEKYEVVRKSMISSRLDDPAITTLFPGERGQKFLQLYVEGALECLIYDMTIYSGIAQVNSGGNGGRDIVKYVSSKNGKDMLYYMLFGAAMLGGGAALVNDDEEGLKNRILATYAVMQLKLKSTDDSAELLNVFAQSVYYVVTGRMLELDPVKKAQFIKVLQAAQGITQEIIQDPAAVVRNVPNPKIVVNTLIADIPSWQAYGLNFKQNREDFITDLYDLLAKREGYADNIAAIKQAIANDPNQALVLQAALFQKAGKAGMIAKGLYFKNKTTTAIKGFGQAVVDAVKRGNEEVATANRPEDLDTADHFAVPIIADQKAELDQMMHRELEKVDRGEQTVDEALACIKVALGAGVAIPQVILEQLTILKNQEIAEQEAEGVEKARKEAAAQAFLAAASKILLDGFEHMYQDTVDSFTQNLQDLKAVELEGRQALNNIRTFTLVTKEVIGGNIFQQRISGFASALAQIVSNLRLKRVSSSDAAEVMQQLAKENETTIWGADRSAQNAFAQGYLQSLVLMNLAAARKASVEISNGQVVDVVDVIKASKA